MICGVFLIQLTCATIGPGVTPTKDFAENIPVDLQTLVIPQSPGEEVICHTGFCLYYNEPHEQSSWVAYSLSLEKTIKAAERANKFIPDPKVKTFTANDKDYSGSGYDRGHLAPAADMSWSDQAMKESFYYSNMSPQLPSFNRGIWKRLEEQVRAWAIHDSLIYVVTGPVLKENLPSIGANKVSVPELFYKVILVYKSTEKRGLGFVMKNEGSSLPLKDYIVSIDSVQRLTGIDFFHSLPDHEEEEIETSVCVECWYWKK